MQRAIRDFHRTMHAESVPLRSRPELNSRSAAIVRKALGDEEYTKSGTKFRRDPRVSHVDRVRRANDRKQDLGRKASKARRATPKVVPQKPKRRKKYGSIYGTPIWKHRQVRKQSGT